MQNCTVINQTEESLTVACMEGYDGGIEQTFHMELHEAEQRTLRGNYTSSTHAVMQAVNLMPATAYVVAIYSSNSRGQSQPTVIVAHTIPSPISLTRRGKYDTANTFSTGHTLKPARTGFQHERCKRPRRLRM